MTTTIQPTFGLPMFHTRLPILGSIAPARQRMTAIGTRVGLVASFRRKGTETEPTAATVDVSREIGRRVLLMSEIV